MLLNSYIINLLQCYSDTQFSSYGSLFSLIQHGIQSLLRDDPYIVLTQWTHCPPLRIFFGKPCFNSGLSLLHYRDTFRYLDSSLFNQISRYCRHNHNLWRLFWRLTTTIFFPFSQSAHILTIAAKILSTRHRAPPLYLFLCRLGCRTQKCLVVPNLPSLSRFEPHVYVFHFKQSCILMFCPSFSLLFRCIFSLRRI